MRNSQRNPGHPRTVEDTEPAGSRDEGETLSPAPEEDDESFGTAGSGRELSGSLPGSTGGTTGEGGENAGIRSPGATDPGFPGISPEEAERLRAAGKHRAG